MTDSKPVSKDYLAQRVRSQLGGSLSQARVIVDTVFDAITHELIQGHSVRLVGFGLFVTRQRVSRRGRNPKTGQSIQLPITKTVGFTPSTRIRHILNGNFTSYDRV